MGQTALALRRHHAEDAAGIRAHTEVTMAKVDFSQPTGNESDEDDDEKEEDPCGAPDRRSQTSASSRFALESKVEGLRLASKRRGGERHARDGRAAGRDV